MFTTNDKLCELESACKSFVLCRKCYNEAYATICGFYVVHVGLSQKEEPFLQI